MIWTYLLHSFRWMPEELQLGPVYLATYVINRKQTHFKGYCILPCNISDSLQMQWSSNILLSSPVFFSFTPSWNFLWDSGLVYTTELGLLTYMARGCEKWHALCNVIKLTYALEQIPLPLGGMDLLQQWNNPFRCCSKCLYYSSTAEGVPL